MNDAIIRNALYRKILRRNISCDSTLVVDEMGLLHGNFRADIAVVNGHLAGYEIKSDEDNLRRLDKQASAYNSVFDRVNIVVGQKHAKPVLKKVPNWWGVLVAHEGKRGGISFETVRRGRFNHAVDPIAVAHLLWRNEVVSLLETHNVKRKVLRSPRNELYVVLAQLIPLRELRCHVRTCLRRRTEWRHP